MVLFYYGHFAWLGISHFASHCRALHTRERAAAYIQFSHAFRVHLLRLSQWDDDFSLPSSDYFPASTKANRHSPGRRLPMVPAFPLVYFSQPSGWYFHDIFVVYFPWSFGRYGGSPVHYCVLGARLCPFPHFNTIAFRFACCNRGFIF